MKGKEAEPNLGLHSVPLNLNSLTVFWTVKLTARVINWMEEAVLSILTTWLTCSKTDSRSFQTTSRDKKNKERKSVWGWKKEVKINLSWAGGTILTKYVWSSGSLNKSMHQMHSAHSYKTRRRCSCRAWKEERISLIKKQQEESCTERLAEGRQREWQRFHCRML